MASLCKTNFYKNYIRTIVIRKYSLRRNIQNYFNVVIHPQDILPGPLHCLRMHRAWLLAVSAATSRRVPPGYNRMAIAHDMVEVTKGAPFHKPFVFTRLDAERLVVDAMHICAAGKGGAV